jgi:hypothetical protein
MLKPTLQLGTLISQLEKLMRQCNTMRAADHEVANCGPKPRSPSVAEPGTVSSGGLGQHGQEQFRWGGREPDGERDETPGPPTTIAQKQ